MSGEQTVLVVLILLASLTIALGLMGFLWIFGLKLLDRFARSRASFELIVALGHLRGRKSGYLKIMTFVVLIAITLANWTLPTVLSVMGGFGNDLKQKILDATAHVLVDAERPNLDLPNDPQPSDFDTLAKQLRDYPETYIVLMSPTKEQGQTVTKALAERGVPVDRVETRLSPYSKRKNVRVLPADDDRAIGNYKELASKIRTLDGVVGVTPFIDADVMLASQTNIASVVLKGVDPLTMDRVIGLRNTIEQGDLIYLDQPEKIMPDVIEERDRRFKLFLSEMEKNTQEPDAAQGDPSKIPDGGLPRVIIEPPDPNSPSPFSKRTKQTKQTKNQNDEAEALPAVVVGRELAKTLRVFIGDEVNVVSPLGGMGPMGPIPKARPYRTGGVFYSGMYQDDAKNAYVRLDVAQKFLGMEGRVSGLRIRVENIEEAEAIAEQIEGVVGTSYRVRPWNTVNANLFSALRLEKIAMFALYSVFFIICAFLIASTLTMMVLEKRRGIAVMKTLGATNGQLGSVFMLQGIMAGLVGTISGQCAAYGQCWALGNFVEIDPGVYYIDKLPVSMEPLEFATVAGLALLTAAVSTVLPLAATVMLRPVDGLRQ